MSEPDFGIDYLCAQVHLSRSQLHRRLKAATGLSASLFIRQVRLERAAELLRTTEDTISEIAYTTGFGSPQSLSRYFQEVYGSSPSAYRASPSETDLVLVGSPTPPAADSPGERLISVSADVLPPPPVHSPAPATAPERPPRRKSRLLYLVVASVLLFGTTLLFLPSQSPADGLSPAASDSPAFASVTRGEYLMRDRTESGLRGAIEQFERAVQLDSTYADAYALLARAEILLANYGYVVGQEGDYHDLAIEHARQALSLDEDHLSATVALGLANRYRYRTSRSLELFGRALRSDPNNPFVQLSIGLSYEVDHQDGPAFEHVERAYQLDPVAPIYIVNYAMQLGRRGQFRTADSLLVASLPVLPTNGFAELTRGILAQRTGDYQTALEHYDAGLRNNPNYSLLHRYRLYALGKLGRQATYASELAELERRGELSDVERFNLALYAAGAEDADRCLHYLAGVDHLGIVFPDATLSEYFGFLRNDPRLRAYLRTQGVTDAQFDRWFRPDVVAPSNR